MPLNLENTTVSRTALDSFIIFLILLCAFVLYGRMFVLAGRH